MKVIRDPELKGQLMTPQVPQIIDHVLLIGALEFISRRSSTVEADIKFFDIPQTVTFHWQYMHRRNMVHCI
jgi:hypothetical protein